MRTLIGLCGVILLMAAVLPAADTDYKIDRTLMSTLTDTQDATAAFFVVFKERANLAAAERMNYADRGRFVIQALQATAARSQAFVRAALEARNIRYTAFWVENKIYIPEGNLTLARLLSRRPEVAAIVPERIFQIPPPRETAGAGTQGIEWNIAKINADKVWPSTKGGGVVVANIDTGVQYNHPALVNQYRGRNSNGTYTHKGNFYDPTGRCFGGTPCDNNGHGTHTMGTMVGDDGGSNQIGVAPGAKWIACKGCASSSCADSTLTACAQWILDPMGDNSGSMRPNIVNNSWGGGGGDGWYQGYVQSWVAAGIFPAFSIGNSGPDCGTAGSPGDYPESFGSGATDSNDVIADYSSRGPSGMNPALIKPDVAAPGSNIRSSIPTNRYAIFSGTSMASPHSAGTAALIWSAAAAYKGNVGGTEQLLKDTAIRLYSAQQTCGGVSGALSPNNTYGSGRIDAYAAFVQATGGGGANHAPTVTITSPNNGDAFACTVAVTFTATATDQDPGDTVGPISWSDNGNSIGTGSSISKTYTCAETGNHTIVASAQDNHGAAGSDTITISIVNNSKPDAPSDLTASVSGSQVILKWTDNSSNETGFKVERKKGVGAWTLIGTTGANVTTYTDAPGRGVWSYRVRATNAAGDSDPSNVVSVRVF